MESGYNTKDFFAELINLYGEDVVKQSGFLPEENQVFIYDCIDSTNAELLRQLADKGTLLDEDGKRNSSGNEMHHRFAAAYSQTAGRGRLGRKFYSPDKNGIYFSFCYVPEGGVKDSGVFTLSSVVGVCRAIKKVFGVEAGIKWVNDIYIGGKKVCGILAEASCNPSTGKIESIVTGIGINIVMDQTAEEGLSQLAGKAGGIVSDKTAGDLRCRLLASCIFEVYKILDCGENIIEEYSSRSVLRGRKLTVTPVIGLDKTSYSATALDISEDGGLIVQLENGETKTLHTGEVSLHETNLSDIQHK